MADITGAIKWFRLSKVLQREATKAMIKTNGTKRLGKAYLQEMKDRITYYDFAIRVIKKEIAQKADIGNFNHESDSYALHCTKCNEHIGNLDNEDNDGKYKYNIYGNYCPNCGQKIEQNYTTKDYKKWGV